jgi:hypothetical protein
MKVEFLPPVEAAKRIHDSLIARHATHDARKFVKEARGLSVGTATLFRWIESPESHGPSLQLFWWAFDGGATIPSVGYAQWFVREKMGSPDFESLLAGVIHINPQKVLRWTKRVPQRRQWELQAAVALAMALQKEEERCSSRP